MARGIELSKAMVGLGSNSGDYSGGKFDHANPRGESFGQSGLCLFPEGKSYKMPGTQTV
jgi:hypothetical protein